MDFGPDPHGASRWRQHPSLGNHPCRGRGTGGDAKQTGWGAPGRLEDGGLEGSSALDTLIGPLPWTSRSSQPPAVMVLAAFDCLAKRESKEKEAPMPRRAGMLTWALHRRGGRCDIHPIERTGGTAPSDWGSVTSARRALAPLPQDRWHASPEALDPAPLARGQISHFPPRTPSPDCYMPLGRRSPRCPSATSTRILP